MANTKPPRGAPHPLPINYVPPFGQQYKVVDGDTWKTLAFHYFINPETLIWFNFKRSIPTRLTGIFTAM